MDSRELESEDEFKLVAGVFFIFYFRRDERYTWKIEAQ